MVPVYNDGTAARRLLEELATEAPASRLTVLLVDDGSVEDAPRPEDLARVGLAGRVVRLRRNVGHQKALAIGLAEALRDDGATLVAFMDGDGEDRPADLPRLLDALTGSGADIAVAQRQKRHETWLFLTFYTVYKPVFAALTGKRIDFGNFIVMTRAAAERLSLMEETTTHVAGAVLASRLRLVRVKSDRGVRYAGASKMNYVALILHGLKSVIVFSEDVLVRLTILFAGILGLGALALVVALGSKLSGLATPGWLTLVVGFVLVGCAQAGILVFMALMTVISARRTNNVTPVELAGLLSSRDAR